jgi:YggT family protein
MILGVVRGALSAYMLLVLIYAVLSWVPTLKGSNFEKWVGTLVEPALKPIRQLLQPVQGNLGIDFSPAVLIMILYVIQRFL